MCRVDIMYYAFWGHQKKLVWLTSVSGRGQEVHIDLMIDGFYVAEFAQHSRVEIDGSKTNYWRVFRGDELQQEDISYLVELIEHEMDLLDDTTTTVAGISLRRVRETVEKPWKYFVQGTPVKRWVYFHSRLDLKWGASFENIVEDLKIIHFPQ